MFTGIIEDIGRIKTVSRNRLVVETRLDGITPGDSVSVEGVCLTAVKIAAGAVDFDVSPETLSCSTLGSLRRGAAVNLERAARADTRLGGHIVSGHVDTVAGVVALRKSAEVGFVAATFSAPTRYIVEKGSVAVNGVSLTAASLDDTRDIFSVTLVPHTLEKTTLKFLRRGSRVNLEYDAAAKYAEKYAGIKNAREPIITEEKLKNAGFR